MSKSLTSPEDDLRNLIDGVRRLIYYLMAFVGIIITLNVGLALQVVNSDETVDETRQNVQSTDDNVQDLDDNVRELNEFVDDLQEISPEEESQNRAITRAVQEVPVIREILCDASAFPDAQGCQEITPP